MGSTNWGRSKNFWFRGHQGLFVEKNSFKHHLNRIYILRDGLDPTQELTFTAANYGAKIPR